MAILRAATRAFGAPGIPPRWTQSAKDAIGTAYSAGSTVWLTVSAGILNEVYYPAIDRPQIRDLQYLVTDGESFFHSHSVRAGTTRRRRSHSHWGSPSPSTASGSSTSGVAPAA